MKTTEIIHVILKSFKLLLVDTLKIPKMCPRINSGFFKIELSGRMVQGLLWY